MAKPQTPTNDDNTNQPILKYRAVPFGMPKTRNNECNNPGRQQYASNNGYAVERLSGAINYFWLDEFKRINSDTEWQSGPVSLEDSIGGSLKNQISKHAGYWSSPAGNGCDWANAKGSSPGSPEKEFTLSATTSDADLKMLYSVGVPKMGEATTNEGMEYGVIGVSGYVRPSHNKQVFQSGAEAEIGFRHIYMMYRADATQEEIDGIVGGLGRIKSGIDVAFDTGKILFPDLLSGEIIDVDKETQVVNGVISDFPDNFDPQEYFEDNAINNTSLINFINQSKVLDVLRDIKLTDNIATRTVLGLIAEKVNQGINKKRGVTGGHNFKVDPQSFLRILKEKGEVNFLDLLGEYAIAHLG